jgi:HSP20 family protein
MPKHPKDDQETTLTAVRTSDVANLFERWLADLPRPRLWPDLRAAFTDAIDGIKVEEVVEGDHAVVRAEMPGIDPDHDVEITVRDHTLHLHAERHEQSETKEKGNYRSEFRYGSFTRTVPLPLGASEDDVKATYKDGILEVQIPIDRSEAEARKVLVQRV